MWLGLNILIEVDVLMLVVEGVIVVVVLSGMFSAATTTIYCQYLIEQIACINHSCM